MGKLFRSVLSLAVVVALLAAAAYWYARPTQALDLAYSELPVRSKLTEILANRKLEVTLNESEVNSLLKKALAAHAEVQEGVRITGARFSLEGDRWIADVNLLYKQQWEVGAKLYFTMQWHEPYLTAVHTGTQIRQAGIPVEWFQLKPLQIPLNDYLPKPAGVRGIAFENHEVKLALKLR
ncbi:hypothetical protein [Paenibacillus rigui]|uniref:DUF2140 domain-containing protein n=1 Tax=Paenibacillus rigui TaxID=554312 RepID=A0A229UVF1_9BACL|nr:hypothetical protein [Paenibacillus rigui]OXM87293.1 hypothetical protein CF651_06580 [Paenibacillus rigui]